MKYWLLTTEYPPQYGGGIGTYLYQTASMLRDNGHEVTVFIYDLSITDDLISTNEGIRLVRFVPNRTKVHRFLGFEAAISYEYANIIGEFIKSEGPPDIIESQEYHGIAYYLQQFKWLGYENYAGLTILITCHAPVFLYLEYNHVPTYQFPYYWTGQMEKSSMRSADILIFPSRYLANEVKRRMSWQESREHYIVNPIKNIAGNDVVPWQENYIVCYGRLSPLKGSFHLLQYFQQLWDEGFQHPLHIIGGGQHIFHPEGRTMEDVVRKKYAAYIKKKLLILHGELEPRKAKEKLMGAHVVIVPSVIDNLPYTVLETMALGKIVLASRQGGQSEVITSSENGFLFDHNKPGDFQQKLLCILQTDKTQLEKIGRKAIDTIRTKYSPETVYTEKINVINFFLKNSEPKRIFPFVQQNLEAWITCRPSGQNNLLSIVIPYYNMGEYIEDCVSSVAASGYWNKEIIIVNDGSTDQKSMKALTLLEKKYPIKVYHKKNEGLSLTRNYGATKATGQYLAFLDADDTVEETYYTKAIDVFKKCDNVHFVGCWVKYFGNNRNCWPSFNPEPPYLLVHNMINSSALVYRKDSFLKYGLNAQELIYGMEDWESVISMVENNCSGVVLPELLYNYRVHKGSMTRSFTRVKQLYLMRVIGERHKAIYNRNGAEIAHLLNANGSGIDFENPTIKPRTAASFPLQLPGMVKEKIKNRLRQNRHLRKIVYKIYKQMKN